MTLILGDGFENFKEYEISENDVLDAFNRPDRFESLENNVRLYLKSFNNSKDKRDLLLLGTQLNDNNEIFAFSYWIPSDYYSLDVSLLDILEIFANKFGLKIKIGDNEGYFIKFSERLISNKMADSNDIIKFLAPDQIPLECIIFYHENLIETLNQVTIYYTFAINKGKYQFWANSYPMVKLELKSDWCEFVKNNLLDFIQPNGQTKIKIQKQKFTQKLDPDLNNKMTSIDVPKIYKPQFDYITKQINGLKNDERIIFQISFESPKCLFCHSHDISKEHIFPKWLRPYLGETTFEGSLLSNFGDESDEDVFERFTTLGRKESSHGYTTNLVCSNCNNTWMSRLENEVKSILINENILRNCIPDSITKKDAKTLSIWLIVKALLLSNKTQSNIHLIPYGIFESLKKHEIDSGFLVESCSTKFSRFDFHIGKGVLFDEFLKLKKIPIKRAKEMTTNFFTCSIQLNHLLFRISYIEPSLPFKRETCFRQTKKLCPFEEEINHIVMQNDKEIFESAESSGLDLSLFGLVGLTLVEK